MTPEERANLDVVKAIYDGWTGSKAANIDELTDYIADDVEWRSLANGAAPFAFTAPGRGKEHALAYLQGLTEAWSMVYYEITDYIVQHDKVVVLSDVSWTCKATEKTIESPKADVLTLKDGKVVAFMEYYDTEQFLAAGR
ncbi:MAG: nuclear transport factor 2 family protein [Pseudomonadota bacterium]